MLIYLFVSIWCPSFSSFICILYKLLYVLKLRTMLCIWCFKRLVVLDGWLYHSQCYFLSFECLFSFASVWFDLLLFEIADESILFLYLIPCISFFLIHWYIIINLLFIQWRWRFSIQIAMQRLVVCLVNWIDIELDSTLVRLFLSAANVHALQLADGRVQNPSRCVQLIYFRLYRCVH